MSAAIEQHGDRYRIRRGKNMYFWFFDSEGKPHFSRYSWLAFLNRDEAFATLRRLQIVRRAGREEKER